MSKIIITSRDVGRSVLVSNVDGTREITASITSFHTETINNTYDGSSKTICWITVGSSSMEFSICSSTGAVDVWCNNYRDFKLEELLPLPPA